MRKTVLICVLAASVMVSAGCFGNRDKNRVEAPKEVFDPEEAFSEIPHDSFEAVWLDGGMRADDDRQIYEETYDFVLTMNRAVIPYTVSGKLIQSCEYSPSEGRWNVDRRTDDVLQEMDLSTYQWTLEESTFEYTETFMKTGPNTFETGEPDHSTGMNFTVDILAGGTDLKDEEGRTNLPGGQWTARLYIESSLYPQFKGEAAIDLIGGAYGYNDLRWIVSLGELKRVDKEKNTTDEERAAEEEQTFRMTFPTADSFELMDPDLASACTRELASSDFGNVGVDKAAAAKDKDGTVLGWVVQAYSKDSYSGDMVISAAVNRSGSIDGIEFLRLEDTPGLGMRANEAAFKDQFIGKHEDSLIVDKGGEGGDSAIDAISGATITSRAVTNAVNAVLYYVNHYIEPENMPMDTQVEMNTPDSLLPEEQDAYNKAMEVLLAISCLDYQALSEYAHPEKGILFSPDPYVDYNEDSVFTSAQIRDFGSGSKYKWGCFCTSEQLIEETAEEYFDDYVYDKDFLNSDQTSINKCYRTGNCPENAAEVFPGGVYVEFHDEGTEDLGGLDWASLKIVMEEYEGSLKVVAVVHSSYTL